MASQNHFMMLLLLCLSLLLCVNGQATESVIFRRDAAQDAIILTRAQAEHIRSFFISIPQLNSLRNLKGEAGDDLSQCVRGLVDGVDKILSDINNLGTNLDSAPLYRHSRSLGDMTNDSGSFRRLCNHAFQNADTTIYLLILRKLDDIMLLANDVRFRVHQFQSGGSAAGKSLNQHA